MIVQQKRTWLLALSTLALTAIIVCIWYIQPHKVTADTPCPSDWAQSSSREVRDRCAEQKQLVSVQHDQQELVEKARQPYVQRWPGFTPQKLQKPTGTDVSPHEIPLQNVAGGPAAMRYATSVWQIDYVTNRDQTAWSPLDIVASGGEGNGQVTLQTVLLNRFTSDMSQYEHLWTCPQDIGAITITSVAGLNGVLTFKSSSGQHGSFNMALEKWDFIP